MKNKFYHISTYSVMRYWTILWMAILSFSCSDFNPMDSYSRIPPDRNTDIDDGDEGDGAGGLFEKGYGTVNKPYLVMDVIQIQNMSEALVKGKKKADDVTVWLVPGSWQVEREIRAEGIDKVLAEAGFVLRQPGCSACLAMNEDKVPAGKYAVSTSNRNFEGRQGPGARTILAGPLVAAAAAVTGKITDPRELM